MLFLKRVLIGASDKGYLSTIDKAAFGVEDYGSLSAARKAAESHVAQILWRQTQDGVPPNARLRARRENYKQRKLSPLAAGTQQSGYEGTAAQ